MDTSAEVEQLILSAKKRCFILKIAWWVAINCKYMVSYCYAEGLLSWFLVKGEKSVVVLVESFL